MFEPIAHRESAVDMCAAALRGAILRGDVGPGSRLPAERALATSFGVNRVTVRSALARLAAARLLSVRQGSGYVVRDFRREGGTDLLPGLVRLASDCGNLVSAARDLLLVRRHLARAVLERLVQDADAAGMRRIRDAVDVLGTTILQQLGTDAIAAADVGVLQAVVGATQSPVLATFVNPVVQLMRELPELRAAIYAAPETNIAGYQAFLAWLETRLVDRIDDIVAVLAAGDEAALARLASTVEEVKAS